MSERMIELQRAKLGLAASPGTQTATTSPKVGGGSPHVKTGPPATPQEAAKAAQLSEDAQMELFINRLQSRDDSQPPPATMSAGPMGMGNVAETGPTVPTALSRRMLQRQGVGYLDSTVASVVSASADRFLATILQQSIACRDQRLKGAAMAKKAAVQRKRHLQHYQADVDNRKRRKRIIEEAREKVAIQAIEYADAVKRENQSKASSATAAAAAAAAASANGEATSKKKKSSSSSAAAASNFTNGVGVDPALKKLAAEDEDEEGYDSIDEEEEYYQERMGGIDDESQGRKGNGGDDDDDDDDDDDEDEEDFTLLLRDIVRPLEAWDFRLTGKETLPIQPEELEGDDDDEDDANDDIDDKDQASVAPTETDNGNDDAMNGIDGTKSSDEMENGDKKRPASSTTTGSS